LLAGFKAPGQKFFGVIGIVNVLATLIRAGMGGDERFIVAEAKTVGTNLKTAVEKTGQGGAALILLGDATPNRSHRISPAG
jgi:hypothetical protein